MDGLSFVDKGKIPDSYKNEIDQLVKKEFANIKREPVHPEIRGILAKRKGADNSVSTLTNALYTEYLKQRNNKKGEHRILMTTMILYFWKSIEGNTRGLILPDTYRTSLPKLAC